jgi:hypothetical protein
MRNKMLKIDSEKVQELVYRILECENCLNEVDTGAMLLDALIKDRFTKPKLNQIAREAMVESYKDLLMFQLGSVVTKLEEIRRELSSTLRRVEERI